LSQYRVPDLRPGTYTVTFTLEGFTTVVRQDIWLEGQTNTDGPSLGSVPTIPSAWLVGLGLNLEF
jgi:hypothetical protein